MTVGAHDVVNYRRQIDDLKCCGNCKKRHKYKCPYIFNHKLEDLIFYNGYCDDWEKDYLTQIKRHKICEQL